MAELLKVDQLMAGYGEAVVLHDVGIPGFLAVLAFLTILVVGFVYEWKKGALDWE